ncbi:carbohydrate ABC transporter permease [Nonomuraea phyllanthi]|uniref:carbohydrate ABC transporter permease n=1 Tax=Nonomuraea phyllanthi TaxID=2219224 RepID=UPI001D158945|nr:carbohydrate ABC transporter permease [Nonomuraea phyllanthi]
MRIPRAWLSSVLGIALAGVYVVPVYWMVATSLKQPGDVFASPPDLIPSPVTFRAYADSVLNSSGVLRGLLNSTIVGIATTALTLALSLPAAYGLARFRLRFVNTFLLLFLVVQMIPAINIALPMFVIFSRLDMVNSYTGLVLANCSLAVPLAVTVLRPYFLTVPGEVVEAATVDGCNQWSAFLRIALPVSVPGIVTVAVVSFLGAWGEFVFALALTTKEEMQPVSVVLAGLTNAFGTRWNDVMAVSAVVALPIFLAFLFLQRFVVGGLTAGASKS